MEVGVGTRISRRGPCEYVLLADSRPHALSVPATSGRTSQVILTTGLLEALTPYEIDLVCAHEEAHLRHRHSHYLAAALVVERAVWFWPPARTSARTLRLALERWADEDAAGDEQSSRNRLRSALVTVATQSEFSGLAAFSGMDGLIERLSALDKPPGSTGSTMWLPMFLLEGLTFCAVAFFAITRLGQTAHCLLSMTDICNLH